MVIDPDQPPGRCSRWPCRATASTSRRCRRSPRRAGARVEAAQVIVVEADLGTDDDGLASARSCARSRHPRAGGGAAGADDARRGGVVRRRSAPRAWCPSRPTPATSRRWCSVEYARRAGARVLTFTAAQISPMHLLRALLVARRSGQLLLARGRAEVILRRAAGCARSASTAALASTRWCAAWRSPTEPTCWRLPPRSMVAAEL